jgi:hypothetical protein
MIATHPKEFIYSHINLLPLIDAARSRDWNKVKELLDNGYSLLWIDENLKDSAMRILAKELSDKDMIIKMLTYSRDVNGADSEAHKYIVTEATIGGIKNRACCKLEEIAAASKYAKFYRECVPLADMEDGDIGGLNLDKEDYAVSANSIFYLCRGGRDDLALQQLGWLYEKLLAIDDHESPRIQLYCAVTALLRAAAQHDNLDMELMTEKVKVVLKNQHNEPVLNIAIAEAGANGHENWAFKHLDHIVKNNHPDLDEVIGECIVSAARQGHADMVFKLCERAKKAKIDKTERYINLLSCAVGSALVNEYFALAKVIMHMVPKFAAKPADLKELNAWPETKIKRMIKMIRDTRVITNIALHSGLDKRINSSHWISALKKEFGLDDMSNAGFETLVHDTKIIQFFLLQYKPVEVSASQDKQYFSNDLFGTLAKEYISDKLSSNDIACFITQMNKEMDPLKSRKHGDISFFRLRHLLDIPDEHNLSPEDMHHCIQVRKEISEIIDEYLNTKHYFGNDHKDVVVKLRDALYDAVSPAMIRKLLEKHLTTPLPSLLKKCMPVFAKHQVDVMH